jgi:hypothetical protein
MAGRFAQVNALAVPAQGRGGAMRYSLGRRIAAATMCAIVAVSSVNVEAFAEVTGADAGAALEEALTGASGAVTSEATGGDAGEALGTKLLSFAATGARVYVDGVRITNNVEVDAEKSVEVVLEARGGYALPANVTLVTNVEDPVLTAFAVVDGIVTIPAGTLTTDGTLNVECTLTGEAVEEDDVEATVIVGGTEVDAEGNAVEGDDAWKSGEDEEDLSVSLDDLTNAEVESTVEQIGDGASDLRYDIDAATQTPTTAEGAIESGNAAASNQTSVLTTAEANYTVVEVEADVENPAFEGYAYVAGAVIKVTAAEGAIPAGTTVEAKLLEDEALLEPMVEAMGGELQAAVMFDITLRDARGNEVQPTAAVNVAIFDALSGENIAEDSAAVIFHVSDDASEMEFITARQNDIDVQSFDVEHFSTYCIVVGPSTVGVNQYPVSHAFVMAGSGTATSPYVLYQYTSATFKCTNDDPNHEHEFWMGDAPKYKNVSYPLFDLIDQQYLNGDYYCVIETNSNAFSAYTTYNQKLYCGKDHDTSNPTYIAVASNIDFVNYFVYDVELDGVNMGHAAIDLSNGIAPMFSGVTYRQRGQSKWGLNTYWYVGVDDNQLLYYWDSYYIINWSTYSYNTKVYYFDYTDLNNIGLGPLNAVGSYADTKITRSTSTLPLQSGINSATEYGYLASSVRATGVYGPFLPQLYLKVRSRASEPQTTATSTDNASQLGELKPGDAVTFTVTIDPDSIELVTDTLNEGTVLTKTSTVTVKSSVNTSTSSEIVTDNAGYEVTTAGSDYTLSKLYTLKDNTEKHVHTFDYIITREDCIAALKKRVNTDDTMTIDLTPSTSTTFNANLRVNGTYLNTSSTDTVDTLSSTTAKIAKEHYVTYKTVYKYAPSEDKETYPEEIQEIEDNHPEYGGIDDRTPYWEGDVIEFTGLSVGQIVEDQEQKGYWVFSGWMYNGEYVTDDLVMGTSDIEVTGEWTYVSRNLVYEMDSWTYDGTYHEAVNSYAGTAEVNVRSLPNSYKYYKQDENGTYEYVGTEHPTDAGTYKVEATWDYIVTNEEALKELENKNKPATQDDENSGEVEAPDSGDNGDNGVDGDNGDAEKPSEDATTTTKNNIDTKTITTEFEIYQVDVTIESGSASKFYDGYPLTNSELTYTGNWIAREAAQLEVLTLGTQTVGNDGDGEQATTNALVVLPTAELGVDAASLKTMREELTEAAMIEAGLKDAPAEDNTTSNGTTTEPTEEEIAAQEVLEEAYAAYYHLLSNYNLTLNAGTLTVKHRTGDNKIPLTVVGTTPEEGLTYNGKLQTVTGYTVNGQANTAGEDGAQAALITVDPLLIEAANNGEGGTAGAAKGVYKDYVTPEADDSDTSDDLLGDAENNGEVADGEEGDAEGDATVAPLVWTVSGLSATGSGKDVLTDGTSYNVALTVDAEGIKITDAQGLDVTHEFAWDTQDGSFDIVPIELTLTSKTVTRAYNTAELTAHEYDIAGGDFARGEGLDANRINWGSSAITRVGSVENWFDIDAAWTGNTTPSNYNIKLEFGTLTVTNTADKADRLDAVVSAKSKQFETTGETITLSGFTSMVDTYATFTVEATGKTLYVEGLTASGSGIEPGSYDVTVSGTPTIWDSLDENDRFDVTECFNLEYYNGVLRIRKVGENGVEFTNRAELANKTYDGKAHAPSVEALQDGTTIYYSTDAAAANDENHSSWKTEVPTFVNVGSTTVYAMGVKDGEKTEIESTVVTIKKRAVTLVSESATKPYDGLALTASTTPKPASNSLGWVAADLEQLEITATGSVKRPTDTDTANTIEVKARGEFENEEAEKAAREKILANYDLKLEPGTLEVTNLTEGNRIALAIAGSTGTQLVYNGQEQQVTSYTANGVASVATEVSAGEGEDATTTTVQMATVVATVEDGVVGEPGEAPEDATAQTISWQVSGVNALGSAKNVKVDDREPAEDGEELEEFDATYPVVVGLQEGGLIVLDEDGVDVSAQFEPMLTNGSFEITRRPVTISSKSASKTYDLGTLTYPYYGITAGSFASGEGVNGDSFEWTASRTSPGTSSNAFSIPASAYKEGTDPNNYQITLAYGNLTVNHITNTEDKFQVLVKSKSDKQRLETEDGTTNAKTITISGFESEIVVNGVSYIPVTVSRSGFKATLYVTNLSASVSANTRGSHTNEISYTKGSQALVYDSMDFATRNSVGASINVTLAPGTLKLYGPTDDILLWTNENDVYTSDGSALSVAGVDGKYYDGTAKVPTIESKYYSKESGTETPATIYYTTNEELAKKISNSSDYSELHTVVTAENSGDAGANTVVEADASTTWVTEVPTFTDAGEHTFYAVGVRDYKDELEEDTSGETDGDGQEEGGDQSENTRSSRATSDTTDEDPQVKDGKRYTELETFKLTIQKRPVTLSTEDYNKTYDGLAADVQVSVKELTGGDCGFLNGEMEKLEVTVDTEEYILPGTYYPTINIALKSTEDDGTATAAASDDELTALLSNYQVIKDCGLIVIDNRYGEDRYKLSEYIPELEYEYENGNKIKTGALRIVDKDGNDYLLYNSYDATANTELYIEAENGIKYKINAPSGFVYTRTSVESVFRDLTAFTGTIWQVDEDLQPIQQTDVSANFDITTWGNYISIVQTSGNAITSTPEWLAANASSTTGYAAAAEALSKLSAWSTWSFTGEAAAAIPTSTAVASDSTYVYSIDAVAPNTEGMSEEEAAAANKAAAEAATWYTAESMQELLVAAGEYSLSIKASSTNFLDCYAFDVVTVKILAKTWTITGEDVTVYDPTMSGYDFTYDDRGNLLDEDGNVVADSDGNLTAGAISGLPAGPAAIYSPEISYNGSTQEVKPVIVDESGYVLTEGVDYYIEYEGDTTNVGTVIMHVTSLASGSFNFSFDLTYEIVASTNGNLKAQEVYYYTYQGDVFDEPSIVANYGGSNVIYSLNGVEYETWEAVVEEMVNAGSYTLAIKADDTNYVAVDGTVIITVQPLDMTSTPQESVESVEIEAPSANTLYVENTQFTYNGEHQEPTVLIVDTYGNELLKGRDYTTSIEKASTARSNSWARAVDESVEGGTYTLCVNYRGNYTGTSRVVYNIDKVAGNEVVEPEGGFTGMVEGAEEPGFTTTQPGSNLSYSVDGGAFVTWDQAQSQLTPGTHTVVIKVTNPSFEDVISDTYTITVSERPVTDTGSNAGSTDTVAGTTGSSSSSSSTGTGSSTSGSSTSAGRTVTAAGSSSTSTNAATAAATEDTPAEAVTVDSTASTSSESAGTSTTADVAAEAAITHATVMYLTIAILTGLLLTAAYSATVIKSRLDEVEELSA